MRTDGTEFSGVIEAISKEDHVLVNGATGAIGSAAVQLLKTGGAYLSSDLACMAQNIFLPLLTPLIKSLIDNKTTLFPIPADIQRQYALDQTSH